MKIKRFSHRHFWISLIGFVTIFFILFGISVWYLKRNPLSLDSYHQDVIDILKDTGVQKASLRQLSLKWQNGLVIQFDQLSGFIPTVGHFTIPKLEIDLSVFAILEGTLAPRHLTLHNPIFKPETLDNSTQGSPIPKTLAVLALLQDERFFHLNRIDVHNLTIDHQPLQRLSLFLDMNKISKRYLIWDQFQITLDPAILSLPRLFDEDLPVQQLTSQGSIDWVAQEFNLKKLSLALDQGTLLELPTQGYWDENGIYSTAYPYINKLDIVTLLKVWPRLSDNKARSWVKNNIFNGHILDLQGSIETAIPWHTARPTKITPQIYAHLGAMDIVYASSLPPILGTQGALVFEDTILSFDLRGGTSDAINLQEGHVKIDLMNETIEIDVKTDSNIENYLSLINQPPLHYTQKLNLKPDQLKGSGQVQAYFQFPLHENIPKEQLAFEVSADFPDVHMTGLPLEQTLNQGKFALHITSDAFNLKGKGNLDGTIPIDIGYSQNFNHDQASLLIEGEAQSKDLATVGLIIEPYVTGPMPFVMTLKDVKDKGSGVPELKIDLTETKISFPFIAWEKKAGIKAELILSFPKNQASQWQLQSPSLNLKGSVQFGEDRQEIWIDNLKQPGRTNCRVSLVHINNQWVISIEGDSVDLSPYLHQKSSQSSTANYVIRGQVNKLWLSDTESIDQVSADFAYDQGIWGHLNLNGMYQGHVLQIQVKPESPYRAFRATLNNVGSLLQALDITPYVKGGNLVMEGRLINLTGRRHLEGTARIDEMKITSAPILLNLLNFVSVTGALEQLNGQGLYFQEFKTDFRLIGDQLSLKDGILRGVSLGITFEGQINLATNLLNLSGVVVPVYIANNLLNNIPLIGELLGGKDEGLFAISYQASGSFSNPSVTTNPLSVVTPGILRRIFGGN